MANLQICKLFQCVQTEARVFLNQCGAIVADGAVRPAQLRPGGSQLFADDCLAEVAGLNACFDGFQLTFAAFPLCLCRPFEPRNEHVEIKRKVTDVDIVRRPPFGLNGYKLIALVPISLKSPPGIDAGLAVKGFRTCQTDRFAEALPLQHGGVKDTGEGAGRQIVHCPAGGDDRPAPHFDTFGGEICGQFSPAGPCIRTHAAQMTAIDENKLRHAPEFADLGGGQIDVVSDHHPGVSGRGFGHDTVTGQMDASVMPVKQALENAMGGFPI